LSEHHKVYVMKFGGSSLAGAKEILQSASIVDDYSKEHQGMIVVCSAMGDTTDHLLKAIDLAKKGDIENAQKLIVDILKHHQAALEKTVESGDRRNQCYNWISERFEELNKILLGISLLRDISPKSSDYFVSFGEKLSTKIFDSTLHDMSLKSQYLTGGEAGITTDESFGSAEPIAKVTNEKLRSTLRPLLKEGVIPVVTGFIAETEAHEITTLGRGGSDFTATLIASALDADEVILWTDVDGIMSADPRIIKNAKIVEQISYLEAMEMSAFGAKAMQPRALEPAARKGIPVRIKNTFNPTFPGTLILSGESMVNGGKTGVKAVGSLTNVGVVNISGTSIVGSPGTAVKIFDILKELGVGILMMSQSVSENNVSLVIKRNEISKVVRAFRRELLLEDLDAPETEGKKEGRGLHTSKNTRFSKLDFEDDVSIVAVLGRGMIGTPGIAGRVFSTVAKQGINIRMIAQGSSEINISFVIKDKDRNKAVAALHEEFVAS